MGLYPFTCSKVPGLEWCSPHGRAVHPGEGSPISLGTARTIACKQSILHPSALGECAL